jgi:inositol-pentakisphosphate 2-kinase
MKHLSTQLISLGAMAGPSDLRNAFTDRCALILLTSPVLPTLSHLQRYFDELDIEGLETVLSSYSSRQGTSDLTSLLQPGSEDEWAAFATSHADRVGVAPQDMASISSSDTRQCVLATLLSGTFKDCSLLVSLPDKTVSVADTEPKPPRKLLEWAELDSHIVRTYADVPAAQRRRCKDANRPPHQQESDSDGQKSDASRSVRTSETFPFLMGLTAMIIATSWALPMLGR